MKKNHNSFSVQMFFTGLIFSSFLLSHVDSIASSGTGGTHRADAATATATGTAGSLTNKIDDTSNGTGNGTGGGSGTGGSPPASPSPSPSARPSTTPSPSPSPAAQGTFKCYTHVVCVNETNFECSDYIFVSSLTDCGSAVKNVCGDNTYAQSVPQACASPTPSPTATDNGSGTGGTQTSSGTSNGNGGGGTASGGTGQSNGHHGQGSPQQNARSPKSCLPGQSWHTWIGSKGEKRSSCVNCKNPKKDPATGDLNCPGVDGP